MSNNSARLNIVDNGRNPVSKPRPQFGKYLAELYRNYKAALGGKGIDWYSIRSKGIRNFGSLIFQNRVEIAHKSDKIASAMLDILKEEGLVFRPPRDKGNFIAFDSRLSSEYYKKESRALPHVNCILDVGKHILIKYKPIATREGSRAWAPTCLPLLEGIFTKVDVEGTRVCDLGSGDGRVCIAAALAGAKMAHGFEIHESLIQSSNKLIETLSLKTKVHIQKKDVLRVDLSNYDLIFISMQRCNFRDELTEKLVKVRKRIVNIGWDLPLRGKELYDIPLFHGELEWRYRIFYYCS